MPLPETFSLLSAILPPPLPPGPQPLGFRQQGDLGAGFEEMPPPRPPYTTRLLPGPRVEPMGEPRPPRPSTTVTGERYRVAADPFPSLQRRACSSGGRGRARPARQRVNSRLCSCEQWAARRSPGAPWAGGRVGVRQGALVHMAAPPPQASGPHLSRVPGHHPCDSHWLLTLSASHPMGRPHPARWPFNAELTRHCRALPAALGIHTPASAILPLPSAALCACCCPGWNALPRVGAAHTEAALPTSGSDTSAALVTLRRYYVTCCVFSLFPNRT